MTPYEGVKRLLPSQILCLSTGDLYSREILCESSVDDYNENLDRFCSRFIDSLRILYKYYEHKKIVVALTGGYDSRTLLSLVYKSGIPFECVTLEHDNMSKGDIEVPQVLCKALNVKHYYIRKSNSYDVDDEEKYDAFTEGLANDTDKQFYIYGQYKALTESLGDIILLRSSIWESVIEYYAKFISNKMDKKMILMEFDAQEGTLLENSLMEYINWADNSPQNIISDANRFYIEQRLGSWLAAIEYGFLLFDGIESVQPLNCRELVSLLNALPKSLRIGKSHQIRIIETMCPRISGIPYADDKKYAEPLISVYKRRVKALLKSINKYGIRNSLRRYMGKLAAVLKITSGFN